jgi:phosphoglycerate dehydrogenase-like enzyme
VGIVGYGSIGREAARLLRAFGMRVLACKRHPAMRRENRFHLAGTGDPEGLIPEAWYGFDEIESMIRQSDVLLVTLPATAATRGLLKRRHLAALPPHALLVNVGRGTVIEEPALAELLREGRIAGAGLDVVAEEPLAAASPLWTLPNVIISPHIGSYTSEQAALASEAFIENMRRDLAGEPLLNIVDFAAGY